MSNDFARERRVRASGWEKKRKRKEKEKEKKKEKANDALLVFSWLAEPP